MNDFKIKARKYAGRWNILVYSREIAPDRYDRVGGASGRRFLWTFLRAVVDMR